MSAEVWRVQLSKDSPFDMAHPAWKLWYALLGAPAPWGSLEAAEILEGYQRWYAHELAEETRNSESLRNLTDDHMGDCNAAADLIDPEVS